MIHQKLHPKPLSAVGGQSRQGQKTKQNFNNKLIIKIMVLGLHYFNFRKII